MVNVQHTLLAILGVICLGAPAPGAPAPTAPAPVPGLAPQPDPGSWPRFRGPLGTGHFPGPLPGPHWSAADVRWRCALPARGHSSPVTWGARVFLTGALNSGKIRLVWCIDADSGRIRWERRVPCAVPERMQKLNSHATPTCATDGQCVVAFFGPAGLHCFNLDGAPLWHRDFGSFTGPFGVGASPIIDRERVIQNCDREGDGFITALDRATGRTLWQTARPGLPKGGWSTPIIISTPTRRELVLNGEFGLASYNPDTGAQLWFCKGFNGRGEPAPEYAHGLLHVVNGKPGDVYAVRPGGSGDVTATHMAWHSPRARCRDCPSPVVVGDLMFVVGMNGAAALYDARTGTRRWDGRLTGAFASSPIVSDADGLILVHNDRGITYVLRPGPDSLAHIAENSIDAPPEELFRSSPAPFDRDLLLRSDHALYRVAPRR